MGCILEKSSIYQRVMKERYVLTAGAVDITLTESEEQAFQEELGRIEPEEQEQVMQIVTVGCRQGLSRGDAREFSKGFDLAKFLW
jgi:hypothetical protein